MISAKRLGLCVAVCVCILSSNASAWENLSASVIAGSAPDNNNQVLSQLIEDAKTSIKFTGYMLRSVHLGEHLAAAAKRGVKVTLLLDGWPVAKARAQKVDKQDLWIAEKITRAGGKVFYMASDRGDRADRRFKYVHAKYAIFDDSTVYITSENFAQNSGHSVSRTIGNRGWAIAIKNPELAKEYESIFRQDSSNSAGDIFAYGSSPAYTLSDEGFQPETSIKQGNYIPYDALKFDGNIGVERVIAPEDTLEKNRAILGAIKRATAFLKIQNLSFAPHWGKETDTSESAPSPVAEEVINAARRGLAVRVMLQPLFYTNPSSPRDRNPPSTPDEDEFSTAATEPTREFSLGFFQVKQASPLNNIAPVFRESTRDNKALIEYFRQIAAKESLDIQAHFFWTQADGITTLHNKGMIVDGDETLISSINWVENSLSNNREVGILVKSKPVGEYYEGLFDTDWKYRRNHK